MPDGAVGGATGGGGVPARSGMAGGDGTEGGAGGFAAIAGGAGGVTRGAAGLLIGLGCVFAQVPGGRPWQTASATAASA